MKSIKVKNEIKIGDWINNSRRIKKYLFISSLNCIIEKKRLYSLYNYNKYYYYPKYNILG